jgi:multiple sugar transport system substrate-binding protein
MAIATLLVAGGCGGSTSNNSTGGGGGQSLAGGSGGHTTLTIADWEFLEPNRTQVWKILQTYENTHPNVTLKKEAVSYADYPATMETQIGARGGPDLLVMVDNNFQQLASAGVLEPLDNVLSPADKANLTDVNQQGAINGHQYGYGWETVIYDFFYNKKLLAQAGVKPPTDLASFIAAAKAVKEKTGNWGFAARNQLNEEEAWYEDFTGTWIAGYGGSWSSNGRLTIDSPQNIQAVTAFKQMHDSGAMDTGDDASTFRQKFAQGKVAMMLDNSDALFTMVHNNHVVRSTDVGASSPPFPTNHTGRQLLLLGVNKYSKNTAAANDFLNWLYAPKQQKALAAAVAPETVGSTAQPPSSFARENPWAPVFWKQVEFGQSLLISGHADKTPKVGHEIMPQIARVLAGQTSPAEALHSAQSAAQPIIGG